MLTKTKPKPIFLKDYKQSDFLITDTNLHFALTKAETIVTTELKIVRNGKHKKPLILDGEELILLSVALDKKTLTKRQYKTTPKALIIETVPDEFVLTTKVKIFPQNNTKLEGLYFSNGVYCTQNEPYGFRRITYYIDRPDVLAKFTTTICADTKKYPVQLANGNILSKTSNSITWVDPHPKPSYLFALVVGNLGYIEDYYITKNKQKVVLRIYAKSEQKEYCWHAMRALQIAMRWEEKTFGLSYDLDIYMIVAIDDFNMGGMENKGLNLFNTKYILANPKTATDDDYINITRVVGHEYFHNWTGDRVTVRDWFQLTLKEGLTVFREQLFSEEVVAKLGGRIKEVQLIRSRQFTEDASPMRHPIQPKSYIEMNNFYTATVYYKGAEVIRMLHTILGKKLFLQAVKLYVKRNDGKAATTEDFLRAMEDASGVDLKQFRCWYQVAGTPVVKIEDKFDSLAKTYKLTIKQNKNLHIPLALGLIDSRGKDLLPKNYVFNIHEKISTITFANIKERPKLSLLRGFSAPIKVMYRYSTEDLIFLYLNDSDFFARWDAGQKLLLDVLQAQINNYCLGQELVFPEALAVVWKKIIADHKIDSELKSLLLTLPSPDYLMLQLPVINVDAIFNAYEFTKKKLAEYLRDDLLRCYLTPANNQKQRVLKNLCLYYLSYCDSKKTIELGVKQSASDNMTEALGALRVLADIESPESKAVFARFKKQWRKEELVMDEWLRIQSISKLPTVLSNIKELVGSTVFNIKNPNKVYSLLRSFAKNNYIRFHVIDGSGYKFLADQIMVLDRINPLVAATLLEPLTYWQKFDKIRQGLMLKELKRIKKCAKLSPNVYEIVLKSTSGF